MRGRCTWLLVLLILKGLFVLVALMEFLVVVLMMFLDLLWVIVYFNFFSDDWLTLLRFCFLRSSGALGMDEALSTERRMFFDFFNG